MIIAFATATACTATPPVDLGIVTPTATPNTLPSTTNPDGYLPIPEAAKQNTTDGAVAFVQFFWDNFNHTTQHPKAGTVSRLCGASSASCTNAEERIANLAKNQQRLAGPSVQIQEMEAHTSPESDILIVFYLSEEPVSILTEDGKVLGTTTSNPRTRLAASLVFRDDHWTLMKSIGVNP